MRLVLAVLTMILVLPAAARAEMALSSMDVKPDARLELAQVFDGCGGENVSPALTWSGAPDGAKSFAVTVYDPDAPTGSGWWHWQVFNIPADVNELATGASMTDAMPEGAIESFSDYEKQGFGGACPPEGDPPHRYIFKVFALDVETLPLTAESSQAKIGFHLNAHALDTAEFIATYSR